MAHRVAGWLQPREGWGSLALLALTGLLLTATVAAADWVRGDDVLVPLAAVALLAGRWTGWRRWTGWAQFLAAVAAGVPAALCAAAGGPHRVGDLLVRWRAWLQVALWGGEAQDPAIFLLYSASLVWGATFFAGWWFARERNGLAGSLPILVLSGLSVFYSEEGTLCLFSGLFCALLLAALGDLRAWQRRWRATEVDSATYLEFDTMLAAGAIAAVLVLVGIFVPAFSLQGFAHWVNEIFAHPAEQVEAEAERLFGGVRPPQRQGEMGRGPGGVAYLPRLHLLGGRPELEELEVFRVWTDGAAPPYWRGATYDFYTGRGWQMTVAAEEPVSDTLPLPPAPVYRTVAQRVVQVEEGGPLYALAEPVAVGPGTVALWHGPGDLAALAVPSSVYTATSRVARPTPQDMRSAPDVYPPEVAERYLQLPDTVPRRVRVLAQEITAGGDTPYDRAVRLERTLRGFSYTLDVAAPPPNRDVADYFLFDLGEGYCDYYATAFVVMARSVGVPARLAVGYAGGHPDPADGATVLVEANAHSWPEVYFPDWGWVRFEPTAGRADDEIAPEEKAVGPAGSVSARRGGTSHLLIWGGAVLVVVLAIGAVGWSRWRGQRRKREQASAGLPGAWRRLVEQGARMGIPHHPEQTVLEYTEAVAEALATRATAARWQQDRWEAQAAEARRTLEAFAWAYNCYLYGSGPARVEMSWAELWRPMSRLRWVPLIPRRDQPAAEL